VVIQTSVFNQWAVLAVSDNGSGMTPEFMERSLFRAFQTTKKKWAWHWHVPKQNDRRGA
jgi:C4-dicarboxylate-specific signal transduction histidine kinase